MTVGLPSKALVNKLVFYMWILRHCNTWENRLPALHSLLDEPEFKYPNKLSEYPSDLYISGGYCICGARVREVTGTLATDCPACEGTYENYVDLHYYGQAINKRWLTWAMAEAMRLERARLCKVTEEQA